ncbi:hypothetical protein Emag_001932 [Eimeria magna]
MAAVAEQREALERSSSFKRRSHSNTPSATSQAPAGGTDLPMPREGASMDYFAEDSTLVVFGGWSGKWLDDLWACCVSSVVGPPYAVLAVTPSYGPMTGGTPITLKGAGFSAGAICQLQALQQDARDLEDGAKLDEPPKTEIPVTIKDHANGIYLTQVKPGDRRSLLDVRQHIKNVELLREEQELHLEVLQLTLQNLQELGANVDSSTRALKKIGEKRRAIEAAAQKRSVELASQSEEEAAKIRLAIQELDVAVREHHGTLAEESFYTFETTPEKARQKIKEKCDHTRELFRDLEALQLPANSFDLQGSLQQPHDTLVAMEEELRSVTQFWNIAEVMLTQIEQYRELQWQDVDGTLIEIAIKGMQKDMQKDIKLNKKSGAYQGLMSILRAWAQLAPLITELRGPYMRERHWAELLELAQKDLKVSPGTKLRQIEELNFSSCQGNVEEITDKVCCAACRPLNVLLEKAPVRFNGACAGCLKVTVLCTSVAICISWGHSTRMYPVAKCEFPPLNSKVLDCGVMCRHTLEQAKQEEVIEKNLILLTNTWEAAFFVLTPVGQSEVNLLSISEECSELLEEQQMLVQNMMASKFSANFETEVTRWQKVLATIGEVTQVLREVQRSWTFLKNLFLHSEEVKRELPQEAQRFVAIDASTKDVLRMGAATSRIKDFCLIPEVASQLDELQKQLCMCEKALNDFMDSKRKTFPRFFFVSSVDLLDILSHGNDPPAVMIHMPKVFQAIQHFDWRPALPLDKDQSRPVATGITSCVGTEKLTLPREMPFVGKVESYLEDCITMMRETVRHYVKMSFTARWAADSKVDWVRSDPAAQATLLVNTAAWVTHVEEAFAQMQEEEVIIGITDASFTYGYEYLGNGPRLVVTPLTDRIYVTATQALHLSMGCAPAGPAGTGKTETTKDLASALGKACYVFNCSDQMDYQSMANIFKGLAASGSWGCFDEFNRLVPAVLSVCSVQFKAVVDAIKANATTFFIQGDETALDPTCGVFITMNPGYLGRSELPEGLKALFRPITVVVPDLELICENMLMAEGFVEAKELARKFTRLYALCKDLLSRAPHYDWGLRAIKSVLVVAGSFKRQLPELSEQAILMKALRDSNLAKIVADDVKVFQGLLSDLFPGVEPPPQSDQVFSKAVLKVCSDMGLTANENLSLKALQMRELLAIRMCIFVMGRPASGKSTVWKVLAKAQDALGNKTTIVDINPKSVSTDELYGYVKMSTREWQDGILSKTMRSLGQIADTLPKWIVLDGDLDANWIESMNSVMDDNRILTLASNERIPLKPHMRMIFEIRDLNFASPATVSRAGIIFVSDSTGEQWRSYARSWLQRQRWSEPTKALVGKLFEKYCPETLDFVERQCKLSVQVYGLQIIAALCNMLEGLYSEEPQAPEFAFVFCLIWAAGGSLQEKDGIDYRRQFNSWWRSEWKVIKFPSKGSIFEYYIDATKFESWESLVPTVEFKGTEGIDSISVPTAETVSMLHFCTALLNIHAPLMCIGSAGCGKTQLCKAALASLNPENYSAFSVNFNFYTDSTLLQTLLEQPLEKKAGRQFGPPGKVHLVYFLDDLNMPQLDPYNTQSAIALLRQYQDYQHWLDRGKMQMKDIGNTQVLAAMNPTAGSFIVNPRLSRHFWVLNVPMPELTSVFAIYSSILDGFFGARNFRKAVKEQLMPVIKATMSIHSEPTVRKKLGRLVRHESWLSPWYFATIHSSAYDRIGTLDELATILRASLNDYNELNAAMDLVLFDDAMQHVCRISRVINSRAGHALVVGVGGSGKQSLTRLSSFINGCTTQQLCISSSYDVRDLKSDIRDEGVVFMLSDAQIASEKFLVYINDLLASGDIADLYEGDDKDQLMNAIRPLAKAAGFPDTREGFWTFFIDRIRRNLHAVLCLSPVGDALRFAYVTPKTFIEAMKLYKGMLLQRIKSVEEHSDRLSCGLSKLLDTQEKVSALEDDLREKTVTVEEKKAAAEEFAQKVGEEKARVTKQSENANVEALKCAEIQKSVSEQRAGKSRVRQSGPAYAVLKMFKLDFCLPRGTQASCEADLEKAIPLVEQAEAALNTLNKKDFQEAKALNKPPPGVEDITAAVMHLLASVDPLIEASVDKQGKLKDKSWKGAQKMMNNPEKFLQTLKDFKAVIDDGRVPEQNFKAVEPLLALPHFNREAIQKKSTAAAGLADWVVNIYQYYTVVVSVEPKRRALAVATKQLEEANTKLVVVQDLVAELEAKLGKLVAEFDSAIAEKNVVEAEAEKCQRKLDLAQRLMRSLGSEGARWGQTIEELKEQVNLFLAPPASCSIVALLLRMLGGFAASASEGTPHVLRLNTPRMVALVEQAIQQGSSVLIENLEQSIDPVLAPLVGRQTIRKGRSQYIKLGDKEIPYNPNFKLFLQTRLSNPHYPPELQAECTLINFTVTEKGDVLENIELIQNLEKTKKITTEVSEKVELAKVTEEKLNAVSEVYRPVARRGASLFFLLAQLFKIHSFYLFSMESFVAVVNRAIDSISVVLKCPYVPPIHLISAEQTPPDEMAAVGEQQAADSAEKRTEGEGTHSVSKMGAPTESGFEHASGAQDSAARDKHTEEQGTVTEEEIRLLTQVRPDPSAPPIPEAARAWLGEGAWACCRSLEQLKSFKNSQASLLQNFDQDALGWARWTSEEAPENADLPRLFRGVTQFEKLLLLRYLRPDRMMSALQQFVAAQLGQFFVEPPAIDMREIEKEADPHTPLFIVLFPGVDPTPTIESIAKSKSCTAESGKFFNISMGQGQEERAIAAVEEAASVGGWVVLQNVHLMQDWLKTKRHKISKTTYAEQSTAFRRYTTIPFEDIRYILGEIMYGGHITDNFDRRLNNSYLASIILPEALQSYQLAPSFRTPDPAKTDFAAYQKFVEEKTPPENPQVFGLHPNAELGYLSAQSEELFTTIQEVAGVGGGGRSNSKREDVVLAAVDLLLAKVPVPFDIAVIRARTKDFQPATVVCLQELERMNALLTEARRTLEQVKRGLEVRARKEALPLDEMCLRWTVTNVRTGQGAGLQGATPQSNQPILPPARGVLIHGFFLQGAAWEDGKGDTEGNLVHALPKVLQYPMPVLLVEAIPTNELDNTGMYSCPVYLTSARGPTYVTTANLRMSADDTERRWILAGVALIMATDT